MNFRKSFELRRIVLVRATEYRFSDKHDQEQGAILKIAEMGQGKDMNVIYVNLDTASEMCDRFKCMARTYEELRPLPKDRRLFCEEIVGNDTTLKLEFNIVNSKQVLEISQKKRRATRAPSGSITIRDVSRFHRYMAVLIEELSSIHLVTDYKIANGFTKVVRGNRVAVIYCSCRPWPWTRSYPTETLLFDPHLVNLLLVDRPDIQAIRDYCEQTYPDLMIDTYVSMDGANDVSIFFKYLAVRWIRQGEKFRINEYPGLLTLKNEEHWYTA